MEVIYLMSRAVKTAGPVNQALNILIGLNKLPNVHARLMTLAPEKPNESWLQRFLDNGIEVVQLNQSFLNTWKCIHAIKEYIKANEIDVIHSAGFRADFVNMFMKGYTKIISTQRCLPSEIVEKFPRSFRPPFEKLHLKIIRRFDRVVACSKSLQKVYVEDYGINVDAVQNGVNTDLFIPAKIQDKRLLRKELGMLEDGRIYLVLGVLRRRKNVSLIIDAFTKTCDDYSQLWIVGEGPEDHNLEECARNDSRVFFTGAVGNPLSYLQASDVLISASLAEGLPNTVLEALSCGLPCILSDIDPHKEVFESAIVGGLFKNGSKEELYKLIEDSHKWNLDDMSVKARKLAIGNFSIFSLANNYYNCYCK